MNEFGLDEVRLYIPGHYDGDDASRNETCPIVMTDISDGFQLAIGCCNHSCSFDILVVLANCQTLLV